MVGKNGPKYSLPYTKHLIYVALVHVLGEEHYSFTSEDPSSSSAIGLEGHVLGGLPNAYHCVPKMNVEKVC